MTRGFAADVMVCALMHSKGLYGLKGNLMGIVC